MSTNKQLIALVGATATGKSRLAVALAQTYNGEIVSADSRQIYKEIPVGTGALSQQEMQGVPHYMIGVESITQLQTFSVARYQTQARKHITHIHAKNHLPFLVGGTGLYIQAVVDNVEFPRIPPNNALRAKLETRSTQNLFLELQKKDPVRAQTIDPYNTRRIIRALEIYEAQQKPTTPVQKNPLYQTLQLGLTPPDYLRENIQKRFYEWLDNGLIDEVQNLNTQHGLSWNAIQELGLHYKWIGEYLQNNISHEQMEQKSITAIHQYARRQMIWFKRDKRIQWIENEQQARALVEKFLK